MYFANLNAKKRKTGEDYSENAKKKKAIDENKKKLFDPYFKGIIAVATVAKDGSSLGLKIWTSRSFSEFLYKHIVEIDPDNTCFIPFVNDFCFGKVMVNVPKEYTTHIEKRDEHGFIKPDIPTFASEQEKWLFIRGMVEVATEIKWDEENNDYSLIWKRNDANKPDDLIEWAKKESKVAWTGDIVSGSDALQFMNLIYPRDALLGGFRENFFLDWASTITGVSGRPDEGLLKCKIQLLHPKAVMPAKSQIGDVGYDLTVVDTVTKKGKTLYTTGVAVQPPKGWFVFVCPRSSMGLSGYIMTNSVGIIDPTYRGQMMLALEKIDKTQPDLVLPATIGQMFLLPAIPFDLELTDSLTQTSRGTGGYGSTGPITNKEEKKV